MEFYASSMWAADRLDDAAAELNRQTSEVEDCSLSLQTGWKGEAAQAFVTLMNRYEDELRASHNQIYRLSSAIRAKAMELEAQKQAEKQARLQAEQLAAMKQE